MTKRILYVQYTNPAGYPPLEHSSRLLADAGWEVLFLGTQARGAFSLRFPPHPRIRVRLIPFCMPGIKQKLHFLGYCLWVWLWTLLWRPDWLYVSDHMGATAAALTVRTLHAPTIFHEHDHGGSGIIMKASRAVIRQAKICIWPNRRRAGICAPERQDALVVMNCPKRAEVASPREPARPGELRVLYHGSINATRLPMAAVEALVSLPEGVNLTIVGYETVGSTGHVEQLLAEAARLGLSARVRYLGQLPLRDDLLAQCRNADVGLAFMPLAGGDANEDNMAGASNKPFDYLSAGMTLLVSARPDWTEMFAAPGYGLACDPSDAASIANALRWFLDHPVEMRQMGEAGRRRILGDWNYEAQFAPVAKVINFR